MTDSLTSEEKLKPSEVGSVQVGLEQWIISVKENRVVVTRCAGPFLLTESQMGFKWDAVVAVANHMKRAARLARPKPSRMKP